MRKWKILSAFCLLFLMNSGSFYQAFGSYGPPSSTNGENASTVKPEPAAPANGNRKQLPSVTPAPSPKKKMPSELSWATVMEPAPNKDVVTNPILFKQIAESGLPWKVKDNKTKIIMLLVPAGTFKMGMSRNDPEAESFERPSHEVKLTKPFYLSETEVTQEQWQTLKTVNPSLHKCEDKRSSAISEALAKGYTRKEAEKMVEETPLVSCLLPVEQVSWDQCKSFCDIGGFSLPTEAQWEYACRAGGEGPRYSNNTDEIAWLKSSTSQSAETHEVKTKTPNALGFYDMIGNVWEWCSDIYGIYPDDISDQTQTDPKGPVVASTDSFHVIRGGAWGSEPKFGRSSARAKQQDTPKLGNIGFRVAKVP
jgi:formylglycine-generating enzyme required for sulfatase activity